MKKIEINNKKDLIKLIEQKISQLNLFGDNEATERAEKKERMKKTRSDAAKKAAKTRQDKKDKENKGLEKDFIIARGAKKDLFGNEVSDKDREDAEKRLKNRISKNKK